MTVRSDETGDRFYVITSVSMATNTSLQIVFKSPSGTKTTKTATLDASGFSTVTLEDGTASGTVAANESIYWIIDDGDLFDEAGTWTAEGVWNDTAATRIVVSAPVTFTVANRI